MIVAPLTPANILVSISEALVREVQMVNTAPNVFSAVHGCLCVCV